MSLAWHRDGGETRQEPHDLVRSIRRRSVIACIVIFWLCNAASQSVQIFLMSSGTEWWRMVPPRAAVTLAAMAISFGIWRGYRALIGRPMTIKIAAAVGFALCGCLLHGFANFWIFQLFIGRENWAQATVESYVSALLAWFWAYAAMSSLLLALSYAAEVTQLQQATHTAQLRALRYQLNPHFMFNTLNSIAALIAEGRAETAERMVENLADFLRATIALDPETDIPLRDELQLQSLYLAIESLRFNDRLQTTVAASEEAMNARVPALITQPLVENVIRHAVSNSTTVIGFEFVAEVSDGKLRMAARNTPPDGRLRSHKSTGVGLRNVAERLRARFGGSGTLSTSQNEDGGFSAEIALPYVAG